MARSKSALVDHAAPRPVLPRMLADLSVLRLKQWLHFSALPLCGISLVPGASTPEAPRVFAAIAAGALSLGWAYGLNAIVDRRTDRSSAKNPLAGAVEIGRSTVATVVGSGVAAAGLGALLGARGFALIAASLLAGGLYSAGPRMKARPFAGLVFNTAIFTPLTALLLPSTGTAPSHFPLVLIVFTAVLVQSQLLHELQDAAEDAAGEARTTALVLGPKRTRQLALVAAFAALCGCLVLPVALPLRVAAAVALLAPSVLVVAAGPADRLRRLHRQVALVAGAGVIATAWLLERQG